MDEQHTGHALHVAKDDKLSSMHQKDLQAKIEALKKSIPKGDKKKKREISAEIAILEHQLWEMPEEEPSVTPAKEEETGATEVTGLAADLHIGKKRSKAQRRREQKASQERERAERIALEEEANLSEENNPRLAERKKLATILEPLGLTIRDIPADGHCLYTAVSDQLSLRLGLKTTAAEIRSSCANYIHCHEEEFHPYMTDPSTGDLLSVDQFEEYCHEIEFTAAWGGLLELRAISSLYKVPISVYQASSPTLQLGNSSGDEKTLTLSYHLHEYGLGEHYNSVVPAVNK